MDIKRESIVVKDVSLSVLTAGDVNGPAVVLLHGFPEEAKAWMEEIQFLSSKGYFVIAPDQRGYGKSDKPQSISDYRLEILGEDIISLMDYFKKERAYLIGHDWGCVVGWHLLDLYKERFIQSILMSSPHASIFQKHLLTNPIQVLKSWYMFTIQLPKIPEMYIARNDYKNFAEQIKRSCFNQEFPVGLLEDLRKSWIENKSMTTMLNWYRAMRVSNPLNRKTKISVPLTLLWGARDPFVSVAMGRDSIKLCERGKLLILDNTGHWPHHENSSILRAEIEKWND